MKRIYFLVPDISTARTIIDELLLARIEVRHLHIIAKRGTPLEDLPEASVLLAAALSGAGLGAWLGGMVGMNIGNTRLKRFEEAVEAGQLLILADVPPGRVDDIEERVRQHIPKAEIEGTEPMIPIFP